MHMTFSSHCQHDRNCPRWCCRGDHHTRRHDDFILRRHWLVPDRPVEYPVYLIGNVGDRCRHQDEHCPQRELEPAAAVLGGWGHAHILAAHPSDKTTPDIDAEAASILIESGVDAPAARRVDHRRAALLARPLVRRAAGSYPSRRLSAPWRNWIAHRSSEPRVGGSNPSGRVLYIPVEILRERRRGNIRGAKADFRSAGRSFRAEL